MLPSRWLADEMLGRLARYMRFVGLDVAYLRGLRDEELIVRARVEGRVVVTRDVDLARRAVHGILLTSPYLEHQWRELSGRFPDWPQTVAFSRCTLCNGLLEAEATGTVQTPGPGPGPVYRCGACGHRYWDGSHTSAIRRRLAGWSTETAT